MTYEDALQAINSLQGRGWRLQLDRMVELVNHLGLADAIRGGRHYVHIAGTNGKGSITAFVQSILLAHRKSVGGFFSPYVYSPRERLQFQGHLVSKHEFASLTEAVMAAALAIGEQGGSGVTEFEFKTAMGFLFWERMGADWVALETGLGGRLDATNVVDPAVSAIVSIGLDHQAILGHTVQAIAGEKAGIIKKGRPTVVGALPGEALQVVLERCDLMDSPAWVFGRDYGVTASGTEIWLPGSSVSMPRLGIQGSMQDHNAALALASLAAAGLELDPHACIEGLERAFIPGRFQQVEYLGTPFVLDGAHNPDSALNLRKTYEEAFGPGPTTLIANVIEGHDVGSFFEYLAPLAGQILVPPIDFFRARPPEVTVATLRNLGYQAEPCETVENALQRATEGSNASGRPSVVTGSFYLVGDAGRVMQAPGVPDPD